MTWSTRRKITYLLIFFGVLGILIGLPAYLLTYEAPSCFDLKQNQREDGVDCGGPCVKLCKPLELLPVTQWQQTFSVLEGTYAAAAYIQNPNSHAQAFNVGYTFKVYGANNTLLVERQGKTNIPAGKNFAVFESGISIPEGTPIRTEFTLSNDFDWQLAPSKPELKVVNIKISESGKPTINADVLNVSYTDVSKIQLTALVYDEAGKAIAASRTFVDYLDKQTSAHIVFTWPSDFSSTPAKVEIIPVIND